MDPNEENRRQNGSSLVTILLSVVTVLLIAVVALLGFTIHLHYTQKATETAPIDNQTNLCLTKECISSANMIISSMNASVDPCDNFYQFACGGYIDTHPISQLGAKDRFYDLSDIIDYRVKKIFEGGKIPTMPETVKQAIDYYEKCIDKAAQNETGMETMFELLESLGLPSVPMTNNTDPRTPWTQVLIRGDKLMGRTPFINTFINQENETSYLSVGAHAQMVNIPEIFTIFLDALNKYFGDEVVDVKLVAKELEEYDLILKDIIESDAKEPAELWMTVAELQNLTDVANTINSSFLFDWKTFLTSYLEDSFLEFDMENDKIRVYYPNQLEGIFWILYEMPHEMTELYNWFYYFYQMVPYTTRDMRDLYIKSNGGALPKNEKQRCRNRARTIFENAMAYEYLSRYFDQSEKQKMEHMVQDLEQAFEQLVKGLDWMDADTKKYALEKLHAVKPFVGYPDWLFVDGELDRHNFYLQDVRGDWLTMNLKTYVVYYKKYDIYKFESLRMWSDISKIIINAFYDGSTVSIYLPAGILQTPFSDNGIDSLNYGAIGAIIGHELTHGFDNNGHRRDKNGNFKNWWSNETLENFEERVDCMIDQYSEFHIPEISANYTLNGSMTINENIADNGGMREALIAYDMVKSRKMHDGEKVLPDPEPYLPGLENYSHKQLFFLAYANMWCSNHSPAFMTMVIPNDVHSPGRERVLGTLANTKEFADAWNCPAGSKMNPVDKCIVW